MLLPSSQIPTIVLYHGDCPDGYTAAWAYWRQSCHKSVTYYPASYKKPLPDMVGAHVIMLDFCIPPADLYSLMGQAKSILVLDHHVSTFEALQAFFPDKFHQITDSMWKADFPEFETLLVFDIFRSGAGLTFDWFNQDSPRSMLVSAVEDRDIWKWTIPSSNEFLLALDCETKTFERWEEIHNFTAAEINHFIEAGTHMEKQYQSIAADLCKKALLVDFGGNPVLAINGPDRLNSYCGNILAEQSPSNVAIVWRCEDFDKVAISVRSVGLGSAKQLALQFKGGGHEHAAGIVLPLSDFLTLIKPLAKE